MKPDPNYPRMMFHPRKDPVTVYSEEQEAALGGEWSRKVFSALPREEKPEKIPQPEPEPAEQEEPESDEEPATEDPAEPEQKVPPVRRHLYERLIKKPVKTAKKKR